MASKSLFSFLLICSLSLLTHHVDSIGLTHINRRYHYQTLSNHIPLHTEIHNIGEDEPLLLTPLIEAGKLSEAKQLSKITQLPGLQTLDHDTYSGYFTVNKSCEANLFFWYIANKNVSAPVLLWLQGGPGAPSLFGMFLENGPWFVTADLELNPNQYSWANDYHLIYIDNPVGVGFSFTDSEECYSTNEWQVSNNLFDALQQFFTVFNELKTNEFYVTGESYAGKYGTALSYLIHNKTETASQYLNFSGLILGNAMIDPINQMAYSNYFHQAGLIDWRQAISLERSVAKIIRHIKKCDYDAAFKLFEPLVFNSDSHSFLFNTTGMTFHYNTQIDQQPANFDYYINYLDQVQVKQALHVGNRPFAVNNTAGIHLNSDVLKSLVDEFAIVASNYKTLLYNGQLDLIIPPVFTERFLLQMDWPQSADFKKADNRYIWKYPSSNGDTVIGGYVKKAGDLRFAIIKKAGHMVPIDQPKTSLELIKSFINGNL